MKLPTVHLDSLTSCTKSIRVWKTGQLLPITKAQPSYFWESFCFESIAQNWNCQSHFNIHQHLHWTCTKNHLHTYISSQVGTQLHHYHSNALIKALHIVFTNNLFKVGGKFCCQVPMIWHTNGHLTCSPMGNILYTCMRRDLFQSGVLFYKWYIDDVVVIFYALKIQTLTLSCRMN